MFNKKKHEGEKRRNSIKMTELEQQVHTNGNGLQTFDEDEHNKTRPADIEQVMRLN